MDPRRRAVFRRNLFLAGAIACVVAALVLHPEVLALLLSKHGLFVLAYIVGAGFFGALGIRELGQQYLPGFLRPWYVRSGSWLFLPAALFCICLLGGIVYLAAVHIIGQRPIEPRALGALFLAFQLFWIAVLDWPTADRRQVGGRETPRRSYSWHGQDDIEEERR